MYRRIFATDSQAICDALGLEPDSAICPPLDAPEDWAMEPELVQVLTQWVLEMRPRTILEIGTYRAQTAIHLGVAQQAAGIANPKLFSIDDGSAGMAAIASAAVSSSQAHETIHLIQSSSVEAFRAWGRAPIDLLLIDGDHDFVASVEDFALWVRYVTAQGMIVIHDTQTRLLRRFPDDYIFPLMCFDILDIVGLEDRPSGHDWEGVAFLRFAGSLYSSVGCARSLWGQE